MRVSSLASAFAPSLGDLDDVDDLFANDRPFVLATHPCASPHDKLWCPSNRFDMYAIADPDREHVALYGRQSKPHGPNSQHTQFDSVDPKTAGSHNEFACVQVLDDFSPMTAAEMPGSRFGTTVLLEASCELVLVSAPTFRKSADATEGLIFVYHQQHQQQGGPSTKARAIYVPRQIITRPIAQDATPTLADHFGDDMSIVLATPPSQQDSGALVPTARHLSGNLVRLFVSAPRVSTVYMFELNQATALFEHRKTINARNASTMRLSKNPCPLVPVLIASPSAVIRMAKYSLELAPVETPFQHPFLVEAIDVTSTTVALGCPSTHTVACFDIRPQGSAQNAKVDIVLLGRIQRPTVPEFGKHLCLLDLPSPRAPNLLAVAATNCIQVYLLPTLFCVYTLTPPPGKAFPGPFHVFHANNGPAALCVQTASTVEGITRYAYDFYNLKAILASIGPVPTSMLDNSCRSHIALTQAELLPNVPCMRQLSVIRPGITPFPTVVVCLPARLPAPMPFPFRIYNAENCNLEFRVVPDAGHQDPVLVQTRRPPNVCDVRFCPASNAWFIT